MEKIPVGFFGYGVRALDALMNHPGYDVKYFWVPESRVDGEVINAAKRYEGRIRCTAVWDRKELVEMLSAVSGVNCFVMNASPIILDHKVLEQMDFYNIHPGDLSSNRGHHPHLWSILLGEKETKITLHRVTPWIDLGEVIQSLPEEVREDDTEGMLLERLESHIPELLTSLAEYLAGIRPAERLIAQGEYRRKVMPEDYHIHPESDSLSEISRKIRARSSHSGGFLQTGEKKIYVDKLLMSRENSQCGLAGLKMTERGDVLCLERAGEELFFHIKAVTDLSGKVLWRRGRLCPEAVPYERRWHE